MRRTTDHSIKRVDEEVPTSASVPNSSWLGNNAVYVIRITAHTTAFVARIQPSLSHQSVTYS